uniref:Collagen type VI alpha 6 chain n=1 Tax=Oreochromis niloticus TaxID=8128 RepID=A0A669BJK6_ORENI
ISQRLPLTLCLLLLLRWQKVRVLFVSSFPAHTQGDIFFLTDSSERISEEGFQKMKNFTKSVISKSIIGLDKVHIGVMQYSTNTRLEFDLTTHYSLEGMLNTIDGMMQNKTRTRTGRAITEVSQYFDAARGGRPWVKQWLVVITDGKSEDSVREPARALRAKGVVIYAIGVNKTNVQELSEISGSLQRAFIENTFDGWKELETKLALEFCEKGKRGCFKPSVICVCLLKADIIFLVDGSESMTEEQFKSTKSFLASVVNQNTVGENLTRFGVILYSRTAKSEFTLKEIYSKGKVLEALQQLVQPKGGTYTGAALAYSLPYFNAEHGGRRAIRVPQILMVITDGDSRDSDRLKAESDALRQNGITVISIGVEGANRSELETMAGGDTSKVFFVDNFEGHNDRDCLSRGSNRQPSDCKANSQLLSHDRPVKDKYVTACYTWRNFSLTFPYVHAVIIKQLQFPHFNSSVSPYVNVLFLIVDAGSTQ